MVKGNYTDDEDEDTDSNEGNFEEVDDEGVISGTPSLDPALQIIVLPKLSNKRQLQEIWDDVDVEGQSQLVDRKRVAFRSTGVLVYPVTVNTTAEVNAAIAAAIIAAPAAILPPGILGRGAQRRLRDRLRSLRPAQSRDTGISVG